MKTSEIILDGETYILKNDGKADRYFVDGVETTLENLEIKMQAIKEDSKDIDKVDGLTRCAILILFQELNAMRVNVGLAERTLNQFKTAIKNKYDELFPESITEDEPGSINH